MDELPTSADIAKALDDLEAIQITLNAHSPYRNVYFYSREHVGQMRDALADAIATLKRVLESYEANGGGPSLPPA